MGYRITDDCILCGVCLIGCPVGAIEEGETKCEIDPTECIECGTCQENCLSDAIVLEDEDELVSAE